MSILKGISEYTQSQRAKCFIFGHPCQLLLHSVILTKLKCICKSRVNTTGLKSDMLGTADKVLSAFCLPGHLNIRILWCVFLTYLILSRLSYLLRIWSTNILFVSKFGPTLLRHQVLSWQDGREEPLTNWFCPFVAPGPSKPNSEFTSLLYSVLLRIGCVMGR